jgi:hypothetical protein
VPGIKAAPKRSNAEFIYIPSKDMDKPTWGEADAANLHGCRTRRQFPKMRHRKKCCAVAASHQICCTKNEHTLRPCKLSHFTPSGGWKSGAAFATHAGHRNIMQVCYLYMQKSHLRKNAGALVLTAN